MRADELNLKDEKDLFEIIIKWIDYKPNEREKVNIFQACLNVRLYSLLLLIFNFT